MNIAINKDCILEITELYNPIVLKSNAGETIVVCMRDTGFEFRYGGKLIEAKRGKVKKTNLQRQWIK